MRIPLVMTTTTAAETSSGVSGTEDPLKLSGSAGRKRMVELWGESLIRPGYTVVPSILLWGQGRLKLSSVELAVLIQLISHRWVPGVDPHPSKERIAARIGRSARQVQRQLTALEDKGFIARVKRVKHHKGQDTNGYDLSGLLAKLNTLAPDFQKVLDLEKRRRAAVERPPKNGSPS